MISILPWILIYPSLEGSDCQFTKWDRCRDGRNIDKQRLRAYMGLFIGGDRIYTSLLRLELACGMELEVIWPRLPDDWSTL
jgi:hypothetical protein